MIDPLRFRRELAPSYPIEAPVFCFRCLSKGGKAAQNPSLAIKYCSSCAAGKQFSCAECDLFLHSYAHTTNHLRRIIVVGPGVRKKVISRGDGHTYPQPLDNVTIRFKTKIYHGGKLIHKEPSKQLNFQAGLSGKTVHVQILGAKRLPIADAHGSSDPFVTLMYNGIKIGSTRVRPRNLNPRWTNETFIIPVDEHLPEIIGPPKSQKHLLKIEIFDHDIFKSNFLGHVELTKSRLIKMAQNYNNKPIRLNLSKREFHGLLGIQIGLKNEYFYLKIDNAEGLAKQHAHELSNPFCRVYFDNKYIGRTVTLFQTIDPKWLSRNIFSIPIKEILLKEKQLLGTSTTSGSGSKHNIFDLNHSNSTSTSTKNKKDLNIFKIDVFSYNGLRPSTYLGTVRIHIDYLRRLLPNLPQEYVEPRNLFERVNRLLGRNNKEKAVHFKDNNDSDIEVEDDLEVEDDDDVDSPLRHLQDSERDFSDHNNNSSNSSNNKKKKESKSKDIISNSLVIDALKSNNDDDDEDEDDFVVPATSKFANIKEIVKLKKKHSSNSNNSSNHHYNDNNNESPKKVVEVNNDLEDDGGYVEVAQESYQLGKSRQVEDELQGRHVEVQPPISLVVDTSVQAATDNKLNDSYISPSPQRPVSSSNSHSHSNSNSISSDMNSISKNHLRPMSEDRAKDNNNINSNNNNMSLSSSQSLSLLSLEKSGSFIQISDDIAAHNDDDEDEEDMEDDLVAGVGMNDNDDGINGVGNGVGNNNGNGDDESKYDEYFSDWRHTARMSTTPMEEYEQDQLQHERDQDDDDDFETDEQDKIPYVEDYQDVEDEVQGDVEVQRRKVEGVFEVENEDNSDVEDLEEDHDDVEDATSDIELQSPKRHSPPKSPPKYELLYDDDDIPVEDPSEMNEVQDEVQIETDHILQKENENTNVTIWNRIRALQHNINFKFNPATWNFNYSKLKFKFNRKKMFRTPIWLRNRLHMSVDVEVPPWILDKLPDGMRNRTLSFLEYLRTKPVIIDEDYSNISSDKDDNSTNNNNNSNIFDNNKNTANNDNNNNENRNENMYIIWFKRQFKIISSDRYRRMQGWISEQSDYLNPKKIQKELFIDDDDWSALTTFPIQIDKKDTADDDNED
eukprot:gene9166-18988_t